MSSRANNQERDLVLAVGQLVFDSGFDIVDVFEAPHSTPERRVFAAAAEVDKGEAIAVGGSMLSVHSELARALQIAIPDKLVEKIKCFEAEFGQGERTRHDSRCATAERLRRQGKHVDTMDEWVDDARGM